MCVCVCVYVWTCVFIPHLIFKKTEGCDTNVFFYPLIYLQSWCVKRSE